MRVLFICSGNICRSALAEYLMRDALRARGAGDVLVSSCGLLRLDGYPMDDHYVALLQRQGIDATVHRSTPFETSLVDDADLILTFTSQHLGAILDRAPRAARKAYLVDDFANLCDACRADGTVPAGTTSGGGSAADAAAIEQRLDAIVMAEPFKRPVMARAHEITDPHRRSAVTYQMVAEAITDCVRRIADTLTGTTPPDTAASAIGSVM